MKKLNKKILAIIVVICLVCGLCACAQKGLKGVSESLSSYKIVATFDDGAKTVTARQSVDYINNTDVELSEVWFHLYPSAYRQSAKITPVEIGEMAAAYPNGINYGGITIDKVSIKDTPATFEIGGEDENALIVQLGKKILPGQRIVINMDYTVKVPNMRHRFGYDNKTVNLANCFPVACVYSSGGFVADPYYSNGDPFFLQSSNFDISITAAKKYTAAMSGAATRAETGDMATTNASILAARDVAVVLGEFTTLSGTSGATTVNYYYYNDAAPDSSVKAATDSLKTFSAKFGEYPYPTLSIVQTGFTAGGMEYSGLEYISDAYSGELYREIIIHETAHQWWFGLVGNNQVTSAWMDEALAEFSTSIFYELNPDYNVKYSDRMSDAMRAYSLYCDINKAVLDSSMNRPLNKYKSSMEYTQMIYVKGQLMFDALRSSIGDDALFGGLKSYAAAYSFQIATPDDMIGALEKSSKCTLKGFFDSWLEGKVLLFGGFEK